MYLQSEYVIKEKTSIQKKTHKKKEKRTKGTNKRTKGTRKHQ